MSLRDRVPVDPLDDERVARIERAVITALPAPAPRAAPWKLLVPVLAATAVVAALAMWRTRAVAVRGTAAPPLAVAADASGARVDLGDAVIVAGPGARFEVTRPDGGVDVHLEIGEIALSVDKRGSRPPLRVLAADVEVVVVGTKFRVTRHEDDVAVEVTEGIVRVHRGDDTVMIAAGEAWRDGAKVAIAALAPAPDLALGAHEAAVPDVDPKKPGASAGTGTGTAKKPKPRPVVVPADPFDELRKDITAQPIARADGDTESAKAYEAARAKFQAGDKGALRALDTYVLRFPSGKELDGALWLRVRILCLKSLGDACRSAAYTYVDKFGAKSDRGEVARRITITPTP